MSNDQRGISPLSIAPYVEFFSSKFGKQQKLFFSVEHLFEFSENVERVQQKEE
jgi:hypothetical protein